MPNKPNRTADVVQQLYDALWVATEHNALHYGEAHNTVIEGRAALAAARGHADLGWIRSTALTLIHAKLSDDNCAGWDVANRRLHTLGRGLFKALGEVPPCPKEPT